MEKCGPWKALYSTVCIWTQCGKNDFSTANELQSHHGEEMSTVSITKSNVKCAHATHWIFLYDDRKVGLYCTRRHNKSAENLDTYLKSTERVPHSYYWLTCIQYFTGFFTEDSISFQILSKQYLNPSKCEIEFAIPTVCMHTGIHCILLESKNNCQTTRILHVILWY